MTQILTRSRRISLPAVLTVVAWLAGCAAPPVVAPPPPATIQAPAVTASPPPVRTTGARYVWSDRLGASAQRLRANLTGGDVSVSQTTDERLWVSLPAEAAFAAGRSAVKPPATGWLDQVAMALRSLPASEIQIVSDADGPANNSRARTLALERAASARDWLVIRGVPPQRIGVSARSSTSVTSASGTTASDGLRLDILIGERARGPSEAPK